MSLPTIAIKPRVNGKKIIVEIDADRFEKLAASLGFFNPEFLSSLDRAERDFKAGRVRKILSLGTIKK